MGIQVRFIDRFKACKLCLKLSIKNKTSFDCFIDGDSYNLSMIKKLQKNTELMKKLGEVKKLNSSHTTSNKGEASTPMRNDSFNNKAIEVKEESTPSQHIKDNEKI